MASCKLEGSKAWEGTCDMEMSTWAKASCKLEGSMAWEETCHVEVGTWAKAFQMDATLKVEGT